MCGALLASQSLLQQPSGALFRGKCADSRRRTDDFTTSLLRKSSGRASEELLHARQERGPLAARRSCAPVHAPPVSSLPVASAPLQALPYAMRCAPRAVSFRTNHILACLWFYVGSFAESDTGARWINIEADPSRSRSPDSIEVLVALLFRCRAPCLAVELGSTLEMKHDASAHSLTSFGFHVLRPGRLD